MERGAIEKVVLSLSLRWINFTLATREDETVFSPAKIRTRSRERGDTTLPWSYQIS